MVANKYISHDISNKADQEALNYAPINPPQAPHFALWIKEQLADKYGDKMVEQGGLRVYTTLDLDIQDLAQQAIATEVGKLKKQKVGNGAAMSLGRQPERFWQWSVQKIILQQMKTVK